MSYYDEPFLDRHIGKLSLTAIGILLVVGIWAITAEGRKTDETCARLFSMATTRRDSMDVIMRCDLPSHRNTAVVPVIVPTVVR